MSVRKRTWSTSKGVTKTAWLVDYVDGQGKRRAKTFDRKKEADAFHATAAVEVRNGIHVADRASITVKQAGQLWLLLGEAAGLERSTLDQRRQHLDFHINPLMGSALLTAVNGPAVRSFEDALRGGGRSTVMVRKVRVSLGAILADAMSRGLCARNAVRETRGVRRRAGDERGERKLRVGEDIPSPAEIRAFLAALPGRWRPMLMTAVLCGLRASELRGLLWRDYEGGYLHIRRRADKQGNLGPTKTASGERTIPVPPMLQAVLEEWRAVCPPGPLGLMFPTDGGGVVEISSLAQCGVVPAWLAAGIVSPDGSKDRRGKPKPKYAGLHALRHFFANWCINRVVDGGLELPAKIVQERLGHSTIGMTIDTYGHLFPSGDDGGALAAGEAALLGQRNKNAT
jgi:integrase